MKEKITETYYDAEYDCFVKVLKSQKIPKSDWTKDFTYNRIKQLIPNNNNSLFTNITRKNQA